LVLELEGRCFLVELERETGVDGGREDLERAEEVEGASDTRREITGEAGAGRVEEGVSSGSLVLLLVERCEVGLDGVVGVCGNDMICDVEDDANEDVIGPLT
jgi:hypothetical protein